MNETLTRIGLELRKRSVALLRRPLNWRIIDKLVRLEEVEEASRDRTPVRERPMKDVTPPTVAISTARENSPSGDNNGRA